MDVIFVKYIAKFGDDEINISYEKSTKHTQLWTENSRGKLMT